jgi:hypothetical protein
MVAIEVNKFTIQGYRLISILLISPPKVIYAELFCVEDTPHFFSKLISKSPCILVPFKKFLLEKNPKRLNTSIQGVTKFANSEFRTL